MLTTIPNILTIAGSDSGGGAGIQADIKTIMAHGCYGITVITALTAQNGKGVTGVFAPPAEFVKLELTTVLEGFKIQAAKTGMLFSKEIIVAIAPLLKTRDYTLVVDPVSVSQSGSPLLNEDAINALKEYIIPYCDLLTPNIPETEMLTGIKINNTQDIDKAGRQLLEMGPKSVLIKGGHLSNTLMVTDYLFTHKAPMKELPQAKVDTENNHGTGCTLSAAIACELAKGLPIESAIAKSQRFLNLALVKSYNPGKGCGPVNHAAALIPKSSY